MNDNIDWKVQLSDLKEKYDNDMWQNDVNYQRLQDFTDIERKVNLRIIEVLQDKVEMLTNKTRSMANILRRPRLTTQFHKEMMQNQLSLKQAITLMADDVDKEILQEANLSHMVSSKRAMSPVVLRDKD